jgi:glutamine amidotransferase
VKPRVIILDYGSGNLRSAERALARAGADVTVTADVSAGRNADGLVVPGVGAFAACMSGIEAIGAADLVRDRVAAGRPVLGICVGMQVLFAQGDEHGVRTAGIGVLHGTVTRLEADIVPHMGWNTVQPPVDTTLFRGVEDARFYFVHSYAAKGSDAPLVTWSEHGQRFVAAVEAGSLTATQFHPEKSGAAGAVLLSNWLGSLS